MEKDLPEEPDKLKATKIATVYSRGGGECGTQGKVTVAALRNGRVECLIPVWNLRGEIRLRLCACKDEEAFSLSLRG